jgi:hypothetical protein
MSDRTGTLLIAAAVGVAGILVVLGVLFLLIL